MSTTGSGSPSRASPGPGGASPLTFPLPSPVSSLTPESIVECDQATLLYQSDSLPTQHVDLSRGTKPAQNGTPILRIRSVPLLPMTELRRSIGDGDGHDNGFEKAVLLSGFLSLLFHQDLLSLDQSAPSKPLAIWTIGHQRHQSRVSLAPDQLRLHPIADLLDAIAKQLSHPQPPPSQIQSEDDEQAILLVDFSQSPDDDLVNPLPPSALFLKPAADRRRLALTLDSAHPGRSPHPALANWFLLHLVNIFNQLAQRPSTHELPSSLSLLSTLERSFLLHLARPSPDQIPAPPYTKHFSTSRSLAELILRSCALHPSQTAIHWREPAIETQAELRLSFQDLASHAARLAPHICARLPSHSSSVPVVALAMDKTPWLAVIMLAVSLSGAAYLNLDISLPASRARAMLDNSAVSLLLTFGTPPPVPFPYTLDIAYLCRAQPAAPSPPVEDILQAHAHHLDALPDPLARLAYIVYTSGSTGRPKAIPISQRNLIAFLSNYATRFQRHPAQTRVLQFASYAFDVSVMNIWDTLAHGATLCMTSSDSLRSDLMGAIIGLKCTAVDLTPSVAGLLLEHELFTATEGLPLAAVREHWTAAGLHLTHLNTGSEPVPAALRRVFLSRGIGICVDYGPSETTVGVVSSLTLTDAPDAPTDDIGRPTGANDIYLLDAADPAGAFVPLGGVGEICVGGAQVAAGYIEQALSSGKFVTLPLGDATPTPIYRTGDLGQYLPTGSEGCGSIRYLGRFDSQVKVSGIRIELGEIEMKLNRLAPRLAMLQGNRLRAVVDKWDGDEFRGPGLYGFLEFEQSFREAREREGVIAPLRTEHALELLVFTEQDWFERLVREIKSMLTAELSDHMLPRYWVGVSKIPVGYTGKTDRKTLRGLLAAHFSRLDGLAEPVPEHETGHFEALAAEAWHVGLGRAGALRAFAAHDSFVKLGGDSIGMMRAIGRVLRSGLRVQFSSLARANSFGSFVETLRAHGRDAPPTVQTSQYVPFELVDANGRTESVLAHLAHTHGIARDEVEDIYPSAPAQDGLIACSLAGDEGMYYAQAVYTIEPGFSSALVAEQMAELVRRHPALRTVFVLPDPSTGVVQAVLKSTSSRVVHECAVVRVGDEQAYDATLKTYLEADRAHWQFAWGRVCVSMAVFECEASGVSRLVWGMHHALSDGWTLELLMAELGVLCRGNTLPAAPKTSYAEFVRAWQQARGARTPAQEYWADYLRGVVRSPAGGVTSEHRVRQWLGQRKLEGLQNVHGITAAVVIKVAVAVALCNSRLGGTDVVFGMVRSGRELELRGGLAEEIVGCCVSVLPVRISLGSPLVREARVGELLERERAQEEAVRTHERVSLGELGRLATGSGEWLDVLVTLQRWDRGRASVRQPVRQPPAVIVMPARYRLSVEVTIEEDLEGVRMEVFYDGKAVTGVAVDRFLDELEAGLEGLVDVDRKMEDIVKATHEVTEVDAKAGQKKEPVQFMEGDEEGSQWKEQGISQVEMQEEKLEKLKAVWGAVLGMKPEQVMVDKSFEQLGGDSIGMMRLIQKIKEDYLGFVEKINIENDQKRKKDVGVEEQRYMEEKPGRSTYHVENKGEMQQKMEGVKMVIVTAKEVGKVESEEVQCGEYKKLGKSGNSNQEHSSQKHTVEKAVQEVDLLRKVFKQIQCGASIEQVVRVIDHH